MTVKDELLIFWVCCLVLVLFVARHFLGVAADLMQHLAALSFGAVPALMRFFAAH
jgi:hypothetical protein